MTDTDSYTRSAAIYDLIYEFKDFPETTERLRSLVAEESPSAQSLLDVGCGTGWHLELLGPTFDRVGIDLSGQMLQLARQRCPTVAFHQADMTSFELERQFDVVTCLFSAIAYVQTPERLKEAVRSMSDHLTPGGILLIEPWVTPDAYREGGLTFNVAKSDTLNVSWMYTAERDGSVSRFDIHYLVGSDRGVEHFVETHRMGLFTDEQYREAFAAAGLQVTHDPTGLFGRGLYMGVNASV